MLCAVQENTVQRGRVFGNVENRLDKLCAGCFGKVVKSFVHIKLDSKLRQTF